MKFIAIYEAHLREMADTKPLLFAKALRNAYLKLKTASIQTLVRTAITFLKGTRQSDDKKTMLHLIDAKGNEVVIKRDTYNESFIAARTYADLVIAAYENPKNHIEPICYTPKQRPEIRTSIASEICREYGVVEPTDMNYGKLEKLSGTNIG